MLFVLMSFSLWFVLYTQIVQHTNFVYVILWLGLFEVKHGWKKVRRTTI